LKRIPFIRENQIEKNKNSMIHEAMNVIGLVT